MNGLRLNRLAWILLDPTPAEGGGATPPAIPPANPPAIPPANPPATPPAEQVVTLPQAEYQRLFGASVQLDTLKQQIDQTRRDAEATATVAKAKAGEIETAFAEFRQTAEGREKTLLDKVTAREVRSTVNAGLIGVTFANEYAAEQAKIILQAGLKAIEAGDDFRSVHVETGMDGLSWVRQKLSSPEMSHFLAPKSTGGAPPSGGGNPAPPPTPPGGEQRKPSLGEQLLYAMKAQQDQAQQGPPQAGYSGFVNTPRIADLMGKAIGN